MMLKRENPELIRRYLLGDLNDEQQDQIEERLLTDAQLQAELSDAQDDLIDDYVLGILPKSEQNLFKKNFLLTPERLHKLRISQALARYTEVNSGDSQQGQSPVTPVTRWRNFLLLIWKHRLATACTAALILFVLVGISWRTYQRWQLNNQLAELRSQRLKVEEELARLNGEQPLDQQAMTSLSLKQRLLRDANERRISIIPAGINILQLKLELDEDKFSGYQAVIETDEGIGLYTVNNLKAKAVGDTKAILLNLPSRLLPTGSYQVHLIGMNEGKESGDVGVYTFQVVLK